MRRLTAQKELRPHQIPHAVPDKQRGSHDALLRPPRNVRLDHAQAQHVRGAEAGQEVVAEQTANLVLLGDGVHHDGAGERDAHAAQHQRDARPREPPRRVARQPERRDLRRARRHPEQSCAQRAVPEPLDDQRPEGYDAAVGDVGRDGEEEEEPAFGVGERLARLVGFEDACVQAGVVRGEARDGDDAFVRAEPGGFDGVGGGEEEEDDGPGDGDGAEDYEGELSGWLVKAGLKRQMCCTFHDGKALSMYPIPYCAGVNRMFALPTDGTYGDRATDNLRHAVHRKPHGSPEWLF